MYDKVRVAMSELKDAMEDLRRALSHLRPTIRPYLLGGVWIFIALALAWDVKRYVSGHPRSLTSALSMYGILSAFLAFDYLVERRIRGNDEPS